ncbi:MAG: hypothetical protein ACYTDU_16980 [Planctomycetota bacterium]|jgi:hypothetical protein
MPRIVLFAILLVGGCALGPRVQATTVPETDLAVSWWVDRVDLQTHDGPPPGAVGLPADLGPRVRRATAVLAGVPRAMVADASDPEKPPLLWVDVAGSGDFAGATVFTGEWHPAANRDEPPMAYVSGTAKVPLQSRDGRTWEYELGCSYQGTAARPGDVRIVASTWRGGIARLGDREFRFALRDANADGSFADINHLQLVFDRDWDGAYDADYDTGEGYRGYERFNLGTGTFRLDSVSDDGSRVVFAAAWPGISPRPFLGSGDQAPVLPAKDLDPPPLLGFLVRAMPAGDP